MSKEIVANGNDFVVEHLDLEFGGKRRTILQVNGKDGSATFGNIEIDSKGGVKIKDGDVAFDDVAIYVDSVHGKDSNPGTASYPLATPDAAFAKLPTLWTKSMVIKFGPGLFTFSGKIVSIGAAVGVGASPLQVLGTPVGVNDAGAAPLGTMTASGATATSVTAATTMTTDGAYRGAYLRNLTNGDRISVTGNTFAGGHTTFNVLLSGGAFTASPGDRFVVEVPATIFQAEPDESIILGPIGCSGGMVALGMRDIAFQDNSASVSGTAPLLFTSGFNFTEAVQLNGGPFFRSWSLVHGARLNTGSENSFFRDAPIAPYDPARAFAGVYLANTIFSMDDRCAFLGPYVADAIFFSAQDNSNVIINSLDTAGSNIIVGNNAQLYIEAGTMSGDSGFYPGTIWGFNFADMQLGLAAEGLDISNSSVDGVNVAFNSTLNSAILTGTGNTGAGINLQVNSQAVVNQNQVPGQTTITGTLGDVLLGMVAKSYAQLPFSETEKLGSGTAASTAALNTITGLSGLTNENAGDILVLSGFTTSANNGTFKILYVNSASEAVLAGPTGMITTPDANDGAGVWTLFSSTQSTLNSAQSLA